MNHFRLSLATILVYCLFSQLSSAQPVPVNLRLPEVHSATAVAYDFFSDNAYLFDGRNQPKVEVQNQPTSYKYLIHGQDDPSCTMQGLGVEAPPGQVINDLYPVWLAEGSDGRGGTSDDNADVNVTLISGSGNSYALNAGIDQVGLWKQRPIADWQNTLAHPLGLSNGCSNWWPSPLIHPDLVHVTSCPVVLTGANISADLTSPFTYGFHFTSGSRHTEQTWGGSWHPIEVATGIVAGSSVYDIEYQWTEMHLDGGNIYLVATQDNTALAADNGLVRKPVITDRMYYYSGDIRPYNGGMTGFDPSLGAGPLTNLQIDIQPWDFRILPGGDADEEYNRHCDIFGVASGPNGEFESFYGLGAPDDLQNTWTRKTASSNWPPNGTIPFDLKIVGSKGVYERPTKLLTATNNGLYYSPDEGANWHSVNLSVDDGIRAPEIHKLAIRPVVTENPTTHFVSYCQVTAVGWDASYVGRYQGWDDDWHWEEIEYTPTLAQHRDKAWTAYSVVGSNNERNSIALINHTSDPYFADNEAVVVQVERELEGPKTISFGPKDANSHPIGNLALGSGNPWFVYNRKGLDGPVVYSSTTANYLDWTSTELFAQDPSATVHIPISDVSSSPLGDFVLFNNNATQSHANQIWRHTAMQPWQAAACQGLGTSMYDGFIAASNDALYFFYQNNGANYLYRSSDAGDNFAAVTGGGFGTGGNDINSISVGWITNSPVYMGGAVHNSATGIIGRYSPVNQSTVWENVPDGKITKIVADPFSSDWSYVATSASDHSTLSLVKYSPSTSGNFWWTSLWASPTPLANDYQINDIKVVPSGTNHRTLTMTLDTPNSNADGVDHTVVKRWEFNVADALAPLPAIVSGTWYLSGNITIPAGQTVTIQPATELLCAPGAKLTVKGVLNAVGTAGSPIVFKRVSTEQTVAWSGITTTGTSHFSYCEFSGATTAIYSANKAVSTTIEHCNVHNNNLGISIYAVTGYGIPAVLSSTIANNITEGMSILGTADAQINECDIHNNGTQGILLNSSFAHLSNNTFTGNAAYGVYCYKSSPQLSCNEFHNDILGEMYLDQVSHPILWSATGTTAGTNDFLNDYVTLITMNNGSYPVVTNGLNNFTVGSTGYFMADLWSTAIQHNLTGNYFNPVLDLTKLYPSSSTYWTWSGITSQSSCGTTGGGGTTNNAPTASFALGYTAEMAGDAATALTAYEATITQYPDSELAIAAAARLLETQRQYDTSFVALQSYYSTLEASNSSDRTLSDMASDLLIRTYVEAGNFDQAITSYEQIVRTAPSSEDSAYAELDLTITQLREQIEADVTSGLDSYGPQVTLANVSDRMQAVQIMQKTAPEAHHEGYSVAPSTYALFPNYPNPFNPVTTIRYYLPQGSDIRLDVFNLMGQKVATLATGYQDNGYHNVSWNAQGFASGVYVYQLRAGNSIQTQKMLLLK